MADIYRKNPVIILISEINRNHRKKEDGRQFGAHILFQPAKGGIHRASISIHPDNRIKMDEAMAELGLRPAMKIRTQPPRIYYYLNSGTDLAHLDLIDALKVHANKGAIAEAVLAHARSFWAGAKH
ncbi:MAG: hypothetical protein V1835_01910 [Candidatus Micrarchaeota archaeon]